MRYNGYENTKISDKIGIMIVRSDDDAIRELRVRMIEDCMRLK